MPGVIQGENSGLLGVAKGVSINSALTDVATLNIPAGKYVVRKIIITNPSTSLAASAATLGVFTAASGGGIAVTALATMTALTAAAKFKDATIGATALTDALTASQLFVRNGVVHGSAATVDIYVFGEVLP